MFVIFIICLALFIISVTVQNAEKKDLEKRTASRVRYTFYRIYDQDDDFNEKWYRENKEDLIEDDDYHLSKKKMIEQYEDEKVYRYLPQEVICEVKDKEVIVEGNVIGSIETDDEIINPIAIFYAGKYKINGEPGDHGAYWELQSEIKKEARN